MAGFFDFGCVFFNDDHGAWETVGFFIQRYIQYRVVLACSQAVTIIPAHFGIFRIKQYLDQKPFFIVAFRSEVSYIGCIFLPTPHAWLPGARMLLKAEMVLLETLE